MKFIASEVIRESLVKICFFTGETMGYYTKGCASIFGSELFFATDSVTDDLIVKASSVLNSYISGGSYDGKAVLLSSSKINMLPKEVSSYIKSSKVPFFSINIGE